MKNIWNQKVSENMKLELEGKNRTVGTTITRMVGELLAQAEEADGRYGSDNKDVSGEMTVGELINWHCDYNWTIA